MLLSHWTFACKAKEPLKQPCVIRICVDELEYDKEIGAQGVIAVDPRTGAHYEQGSESATS